MQTGIYIKKCVLQSFDLAVGAVSIVIGHLALGRRCLNSAIYHTTNGLEVNERERDIEKRRVEVCDGNYEKVLNRFGKDKTDTHKK